MSCDALSTLSQTMATTASALDGPVAVNELLELICLAAVDAVPGAAYRYHSRGPSRPIGDTAVSHPLVPSGRRAAVPVHAGSLPRRGIARPVASAIGRSQRRCPVAYNTHRADLGIVCAEWGSNCSTSPA